MQYVQRRAVDAERLVTDAKTTAATSATSEVPTRTTIT